MISYEALRDVCSEVHAVMAEAEFGKKGVDAIFEIMEILRELYQYVEPMRIKGAIVVFRPIYRNEKLEKQTEFYQCSDFDILSRQAVDGIVLELRDNGLRYIHIKNSLSLTELAKTSVVYKYQDGEEYFYAGSQQKPVIRLDRTALSQFCGHTFFTLNEALHRFADTCVRYTSCRIFEKVWADKNRLFFRSKPESDMRRSLEQFLKASLGAGYEVRPEQVMDESHPVDIKVTKKISNRLMIIEIKWLGDSLNDKGEISTSWRDGRANDGAKQLADYLEQNKIQAPLDVTQGYYVVIDARRRGLNSKSTMISRDDGLYYVDLEIEFEQEYHKIREDFYPPYRMFAEPKCCN